MSIESLGKNVFSGLFRHFAKHFFSQPPIVGTFSYKCNVSLYLYWLTLSVQNTLLFKQIILPKLSIITFLFEKSRPTCLHTLIWRHCDKIFNQTCFPVQVNAVNTNHVIFVINSNRFLWVNNQLYSGYSDHLVDESKPFTVF